MIKHFANEHVDGFRHVQFSVAMQLYNTALQFLGSVWHLDHNQVKSLPVEGGANRRSMVACHWGEEEGRDVLIVTKAFRLTVGQGPDVDPVDMTFVPGRYFVFVQG